MKVFVTGASGFIGSAVIRELIAAGHQVLGLARSDESAQAVAAAGAEVQRGDLDDLDSLRSGAAASDGVIHTAFIHDFSNFAKSAEVDRQAIETLGTVLAGSDRPLVVTGGLAGLAPGRAATEEDASNGAGGRFSESTAMEFASRGVRTSAVRLAPTVHGEGDHGFIPAIINVARQKGVSAYPGDGTNRWSAVHRLDAAHLFRLALENAPSGARLNGAADEGVSTREIASIIGRRLNLPVVSVPAEKIDEHFGWIGGFFAMDMRATSALTQQRFDWYPNQPGLLADLDHDYYFKNEG